jgi:hypothetical protein
MGMGMETLEPIDMTAMVSGVISKHALMIFLEF